MAKKKKADDGADVADKKDSGPAYTSDTVDAFLTNEFGNVFTNGNHLKDKKRALIPFSPAVDTILGGGIHEGSNVIVTGPPKVGKTTSTLNFAGIAQDIPCDLLPKGQKRHVYFFSVEGRLKPRDIAGIKTLDLDHFTVIESQPGNILSAEKFIGICEILINTKPGAVFVVDSYSQLCTAGEMTANIGDRYRADSPLLLARFSRRVSNVLPINKSILIGITHRISNQGGMPGQSPWSEASGNKVQYAADVKLNAKFTEAYPKGAEIQTGQLIHWTCTCTTTNRAPNGNCESLLRYNHGIDAAYELLELAKSLGLLKVGGAWFTFPSGVQYQGKEKATEALRNDQALFDDLNNRYRQMMGYEA